MTEVVRADAVHAAELELPDLGRLALRLALTQERRGRGRENCGCDDGGNSPCPRPGVWAWHGGLEKSNTDAFDGAAWNGRVRLVC